MSSLSTSSFKGMDSILAAKSDVSRLVACFNSFLKELSTRGKFNTTLTLSLI